MAMKLYNYFQNSAGQRIRTAPHLKSVPFEYICHKDLGPGGYRKVNPQGLLPALEINGRIVAQSTAIFEYIEEVFPTPSLLPADPIDRAEVRAFAQLIACDIHPLHIHRVRNYLSDEFNLTGDQTGTWYHHWVAEGLASLEEMLRRRTRETEFCYGDLPGMADVYLTPLMMNARRFGCDVAPYPLLNAVDEACLTLPEFQAAMPENQPDFDRYGPHVTQDS
jgi:maleylpyruvate isomerase